MYLFDISKLPIKENIGDNNVKYITSYFQSSEDKKLLPIPLQTKQTKHYVL